MSEADRPLPICYMHGSYDDLVSMSLDRDAKNRLEAAGLAPEWHEYPMRHEIWRQQLAAIRRWLLARLESVSPSSKSKRPCSCILSVMAIPTGGSAYFPGRRGS